MANLKADLLNELKNEKYYKEHELVRITNHPDMNYKVKLDTVGNILIEISTLNQKIGLTEIYFPEQPVAEAPVAEAPVEQAPVEQAPVEQQVPQQAPLVHQGHTHAE